MQMSHCAECGRPVIVTAVSVSHHMDGGARVDHDADADHVAIPRTQHGHDLGKTCSLTICDDPHFATFREDGQDVELCEYHFDQLAR